MGVYIALLHNQVSNSVNLARYLSNTLLKLMVMAFLYVGEAVIFYSIERLKEAKET